jgi:hypothetical protein
MCFYVHVQTLYKSQGFEPCNLYVCLCVFINHIINIKTRHPDANRLSADVYLCQAYATPTAIAFLDQPQAVHLAATPDKSLCRLILQYVYIYIYIYMPLGMPPYNVATVAVSL